MMQDIKKEFDSSTPEVSNLKSLCLAKNVKLVLPRTMPTSKIAIVGEALGKTEHDDEDYFVGKAGGRLDLIISKTPIIRPHTFITNVIKVRPPDNKLPRLPELGLSIEDFIPLLKAELIAINPTIIIALGDLAMFWLTGKTGITDYRGSVLPCTLVPGLKVIPSFHPAYVDRNPELIFTSVFDFRKAIEQSEFREIRTKPWKTYINPTFEEVIQFIRKCSKSKFLIHDVETPKQKEIRKLYRIGIAPNDEEGMSIPILTKNFRKCWSENELNLIFQELKTIWKNPRIIKIAQNQPFDFHHEVPFLGFPAGPIFDLLYAHSLLFGVGKDSQMAVSHDLGYIISTETDMPFHKKDAVELQKQGYSPDDAESVYNVKDLIGTARAAFSLMKKLEDRGLADFFCGYLMPLQRCLFDMEVKGMATNNLRRKKTLRKAHKTSERVAKKINKIVGRELNANSNQQVAKYLYDELKFPVKYKRGTSKRTTEEEALLSLYKQTKAKDKKQILKLILTQRYLTSKVIGNYLNEKNLSPSKRLHTSYGITGSGRLSAGENAALGHGNNVQNFPDSLRGFVVPDSGKCFLNPDLSQAEALVVVYESGAEELKREMVVKKRKIHNIIGEWVFEKGERFLLPGEYLIAKRLVHGTNYRMGPRTFAIQLGITTERAVFFQAKYKRVNPQLNPWQEKVIAEGMNSRQVTTIYGRTRWFLGRLNETVQKEMVSHKPQSIVAETLNLGLTSLWYIKPKNVETRLQIHDEIMFELYPSYVEEWSHYIKIHMEILRAMPINGDVLCIPVDIPKPRYSWMKPTKKK